MDRMMTADEKLVWEANNVGRFFAAQGHDKAVAGIHDHLRKTLPKEFRDKLTAAAQLKPTRFYPWVLEAIDRFK